MLYNPLYFEGFFRKVKVIRNDEREREKRKIKKKTEKLFKVKWMKERRAFV